MPEKPSEQQDIAAFAEQFVRGAKMKFQPYASYSRTADAVFVYTKDEPAHHKRVDAMFTILYSEERRFVGCIVKGIKSLWESAPPQNVTFEMVFEEYVKRNPKVVWRFNPMQDLGPVKGQELQLADATGG
jgi:hypothetical protein